MHDSSGGSDGTGIDLEHLLGLPDDETLLLADAIFRIGTFHRIEVGYLETARSGSETLTNDIIFGDATFPAGTTVNSHFDTRILRIVYAYSLINDTQKEFGVMGGLHFSRFETAITSEATAQRAISNAGTPLPVVGLHGSISLGRKAALSARMQFFRLNFDRYEGRLSYATLDIQRRLGNVFRVGIGYNFYRMNLDSRESDLRGTIEVQHYGPVLFISAGF